MNEQVSSRKPSVSRVLRARGKYLTQLPGGRAAHVRSSVPGPARCLSGIGIANPQLAALVTADANGEFSVTTPVPPELCNAWVQALDLDDCDVSTLVQLRA